MKNQITTEAIVLSRIDFQEADRILSLLTPGHGKLKVIAKGVRRPKSKLAGGIELLSISDVTVLPGRGELGTLVSSRLKMHYGHIVRDINRTILAYELLKKMNRIIEEAAEQEYFLILNRTLMSLDDEEFSLELAEIWFCIQLLNVTGHMPDLRKDTERQKLDASQQYVFDFDHMAFRGQKGAQYTASHIKLLRLAHAAETPLKLKSVTGVDKVSAEALKLASNLLKLQVNH